MAGTKGNAVIHTTTVTPARIRLFQPTQRPRRTTRDGEWIETAWGRCRVDGRLGQRHADLLEAIQWCAERKKPEADGALKLSVDPARIRRALGAHYSLEHVWVLLRELCGAVVEIEAPHLAAAEKIMGPVLAVAKYSRTEKRMDPLVGLPGRRNPTAAEERRMLSVTLGEAWTTLTRLDRPLYRDPTPLARLRHGMSQAVARHILTHRGEPQGGWTVDGLITAVAGPLTGQARRDARRRLREDAQGLARIGISVDGGRVGRLRCVDEAIEAGREAAEERGVPARDRGVPARDRGVPARDRGAAARDRGAAARSAWVSLGFSRTL